MKPKIISLSKKAISIKSTANNSKKIEKILALFLKQFKPANHFKIKKFNNNNKPSAIIQPKNKTPKIWLNAHLDVVPGSEKLFEPKIVGNRLMGRGSQDMKTAAAAITLLTKKLISQGINIGLILVTDEEIGGHNGTKFLIDKKIVKPKFVIVGESTNLQIGNEAKGPIKISITSKGKSAHSSKPWLGKNAINQLLPSINKLNKKFPTSNKAVWKTTCNLSTISGGQTINQVPDQCQITLDIRRIPQDNPTTIIKNIKLIFNKHLVKVKMLEPHIFTDKNDPFVKNLAHSIKIITSKKAIFRKGHGSADIRFFTDKKIPAIAFGLKGSGLHSHHEWVDINSINPFIKILKHFIINNQ